MDQKLNLEKRRLLVLVVIFVCLALLIVVRLFKLTIIDNIKAKPKEKTLSVYERGEILDCNYKNLAISLKVYSLFCHPLEIEDVDESLLQKIS